MNAIEKNTKGNGENLAFKLGQTFLSRLRPAKFGYRTEVRINGRRCFVDMEQPFIHKDDVFALRLSAENPAKTVYFASIESLHEAGDSLGELYKDEGIFTVNALREAQLKVIDAEEACQPDSPALAGALMLVLQERRLHKPYRLDLAQRVADIYSKILESNDVRWLALQSVIAYCQEKEADDQIVEQNFRRLVEYQDRHGAPDNERSAALSNLGYRLYRNGNYDQAAEVFGKAIEILGKRGTQADDVASIYLSGKRAECLSQLGCFREAYEVLSSVPSQCLQLLEDEFNFNPETCFDEPESPRD